MLEWVEDNYHYVNIIFFKSETKLTASILNKIQTHKLLKRTLILMGQHKTCKFNVTVFITCTPISYTRLPHASIFQHRQTCQHKQPERMSGQLLFFTNLASFTCQYVTWKRLAPKICLLCVGLSQSAICCVVKDNFSDVLLTQVSCHMSVCPVRLSV